jgi:hypothetical protein
MLLTPASKAQQDETLRGAKMSVTAVAYIDPVTGKAVSLTEARNIQAGQAARSPSDAQSEVVASQSEEVAEPAAAEAAFAVPFTGGQYIVGPTINPLTVSRLAAEQHIAVDPNNPSNLVAVVSDFSLRTTGNTTRYAVSTNNGTTWTDRFVPLNAAGRLVTSDGRVWDANSDPVVAIDKRGNVYLANLYFSIFNFTGGVYVGVGRISDGVNITAASTFPVVTNLDPLNPIIEDKEWLAVDNSNNAATTGNVYVTWTRFDLARGQNSIFFSRSTNQGQTWSAPLRVSPVTPFLVQGSQVAVGPGGEIYVAYVQLVAIVAGKVQSQIFLAKSTDGGQTFSAPRAITPRFNDLTFDFASFPSFYRKNSFPAMAVSPTNGNVYVVYSDTPSRRAGAEAEFIRSTDGGATFSAPMSLNGNPDGHQFFPAITVDDSGVIHTCWFDTRHGVFSSGGGAFAQKIFVPFFVDVYASRSTDNGATFSVNARVTPRTMNVGTNDFIGDYTGIAAGGGFAHPTWTNATVLSNQIFILGPPYTQFGTMLTATLR